MPQAGLESSSEMAIAAMLADKVTSHFSRIPRIGIEHEFYFTDSNSSAWADALALYSKDLDEHGAGLVQVVAERSQGQYELVFAPSCDVHLIAAAHSWATSTLLATAARAGVPVSFESRPFRERLGSSLQVNISLQDQTGAPVFTRFPGDGLPDQLLHTVNGMLVTARSLIQIFSPTEDCYARYQCLTHEDSLFSPTTISWGCDNRSAAIRVPRSGVDTHTARVEHRLSGSAASLADAIAGVLYGVYVGLETGCRPALPKLFGRAIDSREQSNALPHTLREAELVPLPELFIRSPDLPAASSVLLRAGHSSGPR